MDFDNELTAEELEKYSGTSHQVEYDAEETEGHANVEESEKTETRSWWSKAISIGDIISPIVSVVDKFGIKKVLEACLVVALFLVADFAYNAIHNEKVIEAIASRVEKKKDVEENKNLLIRGDIGPKVSTELTRLLYSVGADRAFVFEYHNGKENATALPFVYFDMTYEEIKTEDDATQYAAEMFSNLSVSYFKIPNYLVDHTFFIGQMESLKLVDKRFASRLEEFDCKYVGLIMVKSSGVNVGILGVMFNNMENVPDREYIHSKLDHYVQNISQLLDLNIQKKK